MLALRAIFEKIDFKYGLAVQERAPPEATKSHVWKLIFPKIEYKTTEIN